MVKARIPRSRAHRIVAASIVSTVGLLNAAACGNQTQAAPAALGTDPAGECNIHFTVTAS